MRSAKGFSLVEILIATGIMGFFALAILNVFETQLKNQNALYFTLGRTELQRVVNQHLFMQGGQCKCNFAGVNKVKIPVNSSGDPTSTSLDLTTTNTALKVFDTASGCATSTGTIFTIGAGDMQYAVTNWSLENIQKVAANTAYRAELDLKLIPMKKVTGPQTLVAKIPGVMFATTLVSGNAEATDCSGDTAGPGLDVSSLDLVTPVPITLSNNEIRAVQVTTDPSVKAAFFGMKYSATGKDHCLAIMNTAETKELFILGGWVDNGQLNESGGMALAPVDANGKIHVKNTVNGGSCNPSHNNFSLSYSILGFVR